MDWNKEVDGLSEGLDFLKLGGGTHKVKFLDNGEEKEVEYDGKKYIRVFFKVRELDLNGNVVKDAMWTVAKSSGLNSLYGQIALIGKNLGTLIEQVLTVVVKGEGKNKDYTVMEAVELISREIENRKVHKPTEEKVN